MLFNRLKNQIENKSLKENLILFNIFSKHLLATCNNKPLLYNMKKKNCEINYVKNYKTSKKETPQKCTTNSKNMQSVNAALW